MADYTALNTICVVGSEVPAAHVNEEPQRAGAYAPSRLSSCRLFFAGDIVDPDVISSRVGFRPTGNGPPSSVAQPLRHIVAHTVGISQPEPSPNRELRRTSSTRRSPFRCALRVAV